MFGVGRWGVIYLQAQQDMPLPRERGHRNQLAQAALQQRPARTTSTTCLRCCPPFPIPNCSYLQPQPTLWQGGDFFSQDTATLYVRSGEPPPPCCKRASNVQPELLCNPPPSLGKEAATGKGRSYRARGGGSDLRWRRGSGLGGGEGGGPTELLPSGGETVTGDVRGAN